ncbi:MAG: glycosyltransferase family 4 protein [Pseudomonadota bacterium]|nr:glycosyltransferase family 4 protein [Pseudomonadota bacterium]
MSGTVYINGKFTAQPTTGVQRVARCLVEALDGLLAAPAGRTSTRWVLLCPPGAQLPELRQIEVREVGGARAGLHVWEQLVLPRAAREGLLLNLSGSAPAWAGPQVCTLHDAAVFDRPDAYSLVFRTWYRWLFRRLAHSAVAIHTVSQFSRLRLAERLGLGSDRIVVIPNGGDHLRRTVADPSFLAEAGLTGRRFILAVGSESANKNFATLIDAFGRVADRALALVIAGGSRGAVFAAAGGAGPASDPRVVRLGPVGDAQLRALYGAAVALVFASSYEGFGLPPLEAMSCGCPVVASSAAAVPEVCADAALYVDPDSADDIARAISRVSSDATLRADLVLRGDVRIERFSWDAAAASLQAHVESLAARLNAGAV